MSPDERRIDFPNLSAACNDFTISLYKVRMIGMTDNNLIVNKESTLSLKPLLQTHLQIVAILCAIICN